MEKYCETCVSITYRSNYQNYELQSLNYKQEATLTWWNLPVPYTGGVGVGAGGRTGGGS